MTFVELYVGLMFRGLTKASVCLLDDFGL